MDGFSAAQIDQLRAKPETILSVAESVRAPKELLSQQLADVRSSLDGKPADPLHYLDRASIDAIPVVEPVTLTLPEARSVGGAIPNLVAKRSGKLHAAPRVELVTIGKQTRLSFARSTPYVTVDDQVVPQLSAAHSYLHSLFNWREELRKNVFEIENVYLIHDHFGGNNFAHWLMDWAPRFAFLDEVGIPRSKLHFFSPMPLSSVQRSTIARLGIEPSQFIRFHRDTTSEPYTLLISRLFGCSTVGCDLRRPAQYASSWALDFVRGLFLEQDLPRNRNFRIGRKGTRQLLLSPEIESLLEAQGFETVFLEDMSLDNQAALFNSAKTIVSAHGAALSNLIFCQPGTNVLEIFPPDYSTGNFFTVAAARGLNYFTLSGDRVEREKAKHRRDHDISVSDVAAIKLFLEQCI